MQKPPTATVHGYWCFSAIFKRWQKGYTYNTTNHSTTNYVPLYSPVSATITLLFAHFCILNLNDFMFLTYMNFLLQIIVFNRSYSKYFEQVKMPGVTKKYERLIMIIQKKHILYLLTVEAINIFLKLLLMARCCTSMICVSTNLGTAIHVNNFFTYLCVT
jgi:hypothetical protein